MITTSRATTLRVTSTLALGLLTASLAAGQDRKVSFSVDWQGVLQGTVSPNGTAYTAGDILSPQGGLPTFNAPRPEILFTGGFLGIAVYSACLGSGPGDRCIELDALSYGTDQPLPSDPDTDYGIYFTTDEYATGRPLPSPSVRTEGQTGDLSADAFLAYGLTPIPVGPTIGNHRATFDGNGQASSAGTVYRGLGVTEPNLPGTGFPNFPNDPGDNVDAIDIGKVPDPGKAPIWFSLDGLLFEPFSQTSGTGSAQAQGVRPGDVLVRTPGGATVVYAAALQLGLDRNGPPGSDDLDALILAENGVNGYQRSTALFDWENPSGTDMLLFSVRRGSAVIGRQDSLQGLPISEGDILAPPIDGGNGNPAIVIAAEALGLETARSGGDPDEMNGADAGRDPMLDCNKNNREDAEDIADGTSDDNNLNGIPDECEMPKPEDVRFCFCPTGGVCGTNGSPDAGCVNATGLGGRLDYGGSTSVYLDDLLLISSQLRPNQFGVTFMGPAVTTVFLGDGIRCVDGGGGPLYRFGAQPTGSTGTMILGPGIVKAACDKFPPQGCITVGSTWYYQSWYRDSPGSCGQKSNVTNAIEILFTD